jgi:hypothetical protein
MSAADAAAFTARAPRTFAVSLGSAARAEAAAVAALRARGWAPAPPAVAALVWLPYSRMDFDALLCSDAVCGALPLRSALVRKDALVATARAAAVHTPASGVVARGDEPAARAAALAAAGAGPWVVKEPAANNALGVRFAAGAAARDAAVAAALGAAPRAVVQAVERAPRLFCGAKWHARVNVAAVGACAVYVHRDAVAHVACEAWADDADPGARPFAHVTNNALQRTHAAYARAAHTRALEDVLGDDAPRAFAAVCAAVRALFDAALAGRGAAEGAWAPLPAGGGARDDGGGGAREGAPPLPFFAAPQCFELFGFDFLVRDGDGAPLLLEVNAGPSLEAAAWPELCDRVVADAVALVVDALDDDRSPRAPGALSRAWAAPPVPAEGSGWVRVR